MTIDIFTNRVPWGLLTPEEKELFREHEKLGGKFVFKSNRDVDSIASTNKAFHWDVFKALPIPPQPKPIECWAVIKNPGFTEFYSSKHVAEFVASARHRIVKLREVVGEQ